MEEVVIDTYYYVRFTGIHHLPKLVAKVVDDYYDDAMMIVTYTNWICVFHGAAHTQLYHLSNGLHRGQLASRHGQPVGFYLSLYSILRP